MIKKFLCTIVLTIALLWSFTPTPAAAWFSTGTECCYIFFNGAWFYDYHLWHYHYYRGGNYPLYYRHDFIPHYYRRYYYPRQDRRYNNNNSYRQHRHY